MPRTIKPQSCSVRVVRPDPDRSGHGPEALRELVEAQKRADQAARGFDATGVIDLTGGPKRRLAEAPATKRARARKATKAT
jgi:hypothetical protein